VSRFHDAQAADLALQQFNAQFRDGAMPDDMPEVTLAGAPMGLLQVLRQSGLVASASEGQRNVEQGGVRIDGERIDDRALRVESGTYVVQVGKRRFARITLTG